VRPTLGNEQLWNLICLCASQWRIGFGGPYALDFNAVFGAADILGMRLNQRDIEKLQVYEEEVLKLRAAGKQSKGVCDEKQKAQCSEEFGEFLDWACGQCEQNPNRGKEAVTDGSQ
jgi:hypothetical protein